MKSRLYDVWKENRKNTRFVWRRKRQTSQSSTKKQPLQTRLARYTTNVTFYTLILLSFFTWISGAECTQRLVENEYCIVCIKCTTTRLWGWKCTPGPDYPCWIPGDYDFLARWSRLHLFLNVENRRCEISFDWLRCVRNDVSPYGPMDESLSFIRPVPSWVGGSFRTGWTQRHFPALLVVNTGGSGAERQVGMSVSKIQVKALNFTTERLWQSSYGCSPETWWSGIMMGWQMFRKCRITRNWTCPLIDSLCLVHCSCRQ